MSAKGETAAITPELYNAIVTIVDDRTKDIRVTREDFNELRASQVVPIQFSPCEVL